MQHRIITHSGSIPNNMLTFKNGSELYFKPVLYMNDTREMRMSALHGLGIVELHDYIVAEDLKENTLVEILGRYVEPLPTIPLYIAYPQTSHLPMKVRRFIDFVVDLCKNVY